jgi:hypothetical protein
MEIFSYHEGLGKWIEIANVRILLPISLLLHHLHPPLPRVVNMNHELVQLSIWNHELVQPREADADDGPMSSRNLKLIK